MNDPRDAWQNQPTEPFHMSAEQLRHKAHQRHRKARFEAFFSIALGLILAFSFGLACYRAGQILPRIGLGVIGFWCLFFAVQAYRWILPGRLEPDAALSTCLTFYRAELEKRRDYVLHIWRRSGLTFCFVGLALIVVPELIQARKSLRLLMNASPFLLLLALWTLAFRYKNNQGRQKLAQDIAELRAFERDNS